MILYLDTSAALKLILAEAESGPLATELTAAVARGDDLISSMLLFTELHCAAVRRGLDPEALTTVLEGVDLVDLTREDLLRAGTSHWGLRSADAIHLAAALRVGADAMVVYDLELSDRVVEVGLRLFAPAD